MKTLIFLMAFLSLISNIAFADCDWKSDITPGPNHTFIYSEACHLQVGQLVQDAKVKDQQIADLNKALQLKDLALTNADARTQLWMTSTQNEQDRMAKIESSQKQSYEGAFFSVFLKTKAMTS